jgi:hypothetical protein
MKILFRDLQVGSCFIGPKGEKKKKTADGKASVRRDNGRVSTRKVKADLEVEPSPCDIGLLGVGLRRHPEVVVEIGDGNPFRKKKS